MRKGATDFFARSERFRRADLYPAPISREPPNATPQWRHIRQAMNEHSF
jgi:hypothetical protein